MRAESFQFDYPVPVSAVSIIREGHAVYVVLSSLRGLTSARLLVPDDPGPPRRELEYKAQLDAIRAILDP